jgi:hypothetical protein
MHVLLEVASLYLLACVLVVHVPVIDSIASIIGASMKGVCLTPTLDIARAQNRHHAGQNRAMIGLSEIGSAR